MSKKLRVHQHRPKREEAKAKELADTKKENHHLRRKLKRLEKEFRRHAPPPDVMEDEDVPTLAESKGKIVEKCKKCYEGIIRILHLAGRKYAVCPECKDRKRIE